MNHYNLHYGGRCTCCSITHRTPLALEEQLGNVIILRAAASPVNTYVSVSFFAFTLPPIHCPLADTIEDQFEKFINLGDDRNIVEVYVQGELVKGGGAFTGVWHTSLQYWGGITDKGREVNATALKCMGRVCVEDACMH